MLILQSGGDATTPLSLRLLLKNRFFRLLSQGQCYGFWPGNGGQQSHWCLDFLQSRMGPSCPSWDPCFGLQIKAVIHLSMSDMPESRTREVGLCQPMDKNSTVERECVCVCVHVCTCYMCKMAFLARKETPDSSLHPPLPSPCVPSQFTWYSFSPNAEATVGWVMPLAECSRPSGEVWSESLRLCQSPPVF